MTTELRIRIPTPPGLSLLRRGATEAWQTTAGAVHGALALARALPSIATSMERLAELQDELQALGELDLQLERLADLQDELATLGRLEGALDQIAKFGTPLDRLTEPVEDLARAARTLPELSLAAQSLPALVEQVKGVERLVAHMDERLDTLAPFLAQIAEFGEEVGDDIDDLGEALEPISRLAKLVPGGRRKRED